jgi:hypothetical protein
MCYLLDISSLTLFNTRLLLGYGVNFIVLILFYAMVYLSNLSYFDVWIDPYGKPVLPDRRTPKQSMILTRSLSTSSMLLRSVSDMLTQTIIYLFYKPIVSRNKKGENENEQFILQLYKRKWHMLVMLYILIGIYLIH